MKTVKKIDCFVTIKRNTTKNPGLLSKFDDGKTDLLKRLSEKFRNGELVDLVYGEYYEITEISKQTYKLLNVKGMEFKFI